jgi:hypothetical protein
MRMRTRVVGIRIRMCTVSRVLRSSRSDSGVTFGVLLLPESRSFGAGLTTPPFGRLKVSRPGAASWRPTVRGDGGIGRPAPKPQLEQPARRKAWATRLRHESIGCLGCQPALPGENPQPHTRGSRRRPGVFLVHVRPMNLRAHDGLASIIIPGWNQLEDTLLCLPALVRHPIASGSSRRVSRGPANPAPRMKRPCGQARHELRRYMAIRYPARYRNAF